VWSPRPRGQPRCRQYSVAGYRDDDAGAAVDQRVDPVEVLAYVSEHDGRQRAFEVWLHKAAKAGWAVAVESTAPPDATGSQCGTVDVEGLLYRIHHGKRVRKLVGYTPVTEHLISAAVKHLQGEETPGTTWVWEFTHAAWAEPILPDSA
jgi:hypothetical protein